MNIGSDFHHQSSLRPPRAARHGHVGSDPGQRPPAGQQLRLLRQFLHVILTTNLSANYTTLAYRDGTTEFHLITTSGANTPIILTNAAKIGHTNSFKVTSAVGQSLVIQFNTNNTLNSSQWQTLLSTNSATGVVQVNDSVNATKPFVIYRAQSGP